MTLTINRIAAALAIAAVACVSQISMATTPTHAAKAPAKAAVSNAPLIVKCAVTGEIIGSPAKAYGTSIYKGHEYYFCCPSCKPEFDANPKKFSNANNGYPITPKPAAKKKA
ncbi:MAG TPA: YHS domain-containing protein [Capsulimonadaceae bacterium]|jgi:YHS domain-containing protein